MPILRRRVKAWLWPTVLLLSLQTGMGQDKNSLWLSPKVKVTLGSTKSQVEGSLPANCTLDKRHDNQYGIRDNDTDRMLGSMDVNEVLFKLD